MSVTELASTNAIRSYFMTAWGSTTPIARPNVEFNETPVPDPTTPSTTSWIRFSIENAETLQAHLSTTVTDEFAQGAVSIQIFVPKGADEAHGLTLADTAAALFRRQTIAAARATFRTPTIRRVPTSDTDPWYQFNVRAPYWRQ